MDYEKRPVRIACRIQGVWRTAEVDAICIHEFAVFHQSLIEEAFDAVVASGWSVTHVRTGYAAIPNVPSRAKAIDAVERLMAMDVDWVFTDPSTAAHMPPETKRRVREIRDEVMGFGGGL